MKSLKQIILCLVLVFIGNNLSAQLNIKVAYSLNFLNSKVNNSILNNFNERNDWLGEEGEFKNWRSLHGLSLGLLYRTEFFGFEAYYTNRVNKLEARGNDPLISGGFEGDLFYKLNSWTLGYEVYYSFFGLGATLDWSKFKLNYEINNDNNIRKLINNDFLSSKFYFILQLPGNEVISLAIKPFVQIPWGSIDFRGLDEALNPGGSGLNDYQERVVSFGISFVFYNGKNYYID